MKRRQFLTITGAAVTAAACTPPPEPPKPVAEVQKPADTIRLQKFDNFPFTPLKGDHGFAMTLEGLCAFVLPYGGLAKAKRLDALLVRGEKDHEHRPSLFVPRQVWMHGEVQGVTLAEPVALDPHHAVFALDGMRVKIVQQDTAGRYPGDPQPSLTFNKNPSDNTVCPTDVNTLAGFRWLLDFASELAVTGSAAKIAQNWRTMYSLYHTHIELLTGRIEDANDLTNVRTAAVGHRWELSNGKTRLLKEILHFGLTEKKVTHIKLEPLAGGQATSIFVDSVAFFAPVGVMHVAKHYTAPEDVKENAYEAMDLKYLSGLIPNVKFKVPKVVNLKKCVVDSTPECGCCPPGFIEDLP